MLYDCSFDEARHRMISAPYAPEKNQRAVHYPASDGKPMAETDLHVLEIVSLLEVLREYFKNDELVYVAANNFIYYKEGDNKKRVSPDVYVVLGVPKHLRRSFFVWEEN